MKARNYKVLRYGLKPIGPLLLLYVVFWKLDLHLLRAHLERVELWTFALAYIVGMPMLMLKSIRWRQLVRANPGAELPLLACYGYSWAGSFLGLVTPGRFGELYKVAYVRGRGMTLGRAASTVLLDRAFDVAVPLGTLAVGALLHPRMRSLAIGQAAFLLLAVLAAAAVVLWFLRRRLGGWARRAAQGIGRLRPARQAPHVFEEFLAAFRTVRAADWVVCVLLTAGVWTLYCGQRLVMAAAAGMHVEVVYFSLAFLAAAIFSALPVSVAGIGTRDVTLIVLLGHAGVTPEEAIVLSTLILLGILVNTLTGFVAFLLVPRPKGEIKWNDPDAVPIGDPTSAGTLP